MYMFVVFYNNRANIFLEVSRQVQCEIPSELAWYINLLDEQRGATPKAVLFTRFGMSYINMFRSLCNRVRCRLVILSGVQCFIT